MTMPIVTSSRQPTAAAVSSQPGTSPVDRRHQKGQNTGTMNTATTKVTTSSGRPSFQ